MRAGEAETLMKGSLHTDELMGEVVRKDTGLRTERRISHAFIMDVPTYPKPLAVTDAAINIFPDLETKVDIVQNAIDMAHALGVDLPKVAILSAVETVTPKIPSTIDAAALCKMAERGQITGGLLDGPLAFDNAISKEAAAIKGIRSEVAGDADILVVPDLEAGNMLAKQLSFLANADAAGIVLGARVPIILTSRADTVRARMASCAVAVLPRPCPPAAGGRARRRSSDGDGRRGPDHQRRLVEPQVLGLCGRRRRPAEPVGSRARSRASAPRRISWPRTPTGRCCVDRRWPDARGLRPRRVLPRARRLAARAAGRRPGSQASATAWSMAAPTSQHRCAIDAAVLARLERSARSPRCISRTISPASARSPRRQPDLPQVACFDTAFHRAPPRARRLVRPAAPLL